MKNILGLDLGTNSIGWALIQYKSEEQKPDTKLGSRIIPMTQDVLGKFDSGVTESQTSVRTGYRGMRRIRERNLLRRERLFRVLHILGFLPSHFDNAIGWNKSDNRTYGKFKDESEPKLAWRKGADGKMKFIFMDAFNEMLADFSKSQPQLTADGHLIPLDWTIYYLRHKALSQPITAQQLAWIILNFNQKRGYYQLRGEESEEENKPTKREEYLPLRIDKVEATNEKSGDNIWYNLHLENGWIYRRRSKLPLFDWEGKTKEFIVTTDLNPDGTEKLDKEGSVKRSFRAPNADDWTLLKKRTEASIEESDETVGSFIYNTLLNKPNEKIIGKLVRTIERKYYRQELELILRKQAEFIPELRDYKMLQACVSELYPSNEAHRNSLLRKDIIYLLINDILFYQRPLKSKKSLIADCPYEYYEYVDKQTGEIKIQHIKCIAKSNPYFQKFRLIQFVQNLRLFNRESLNDDEVTDQYIKDEADRKRLFDYLNDRKEIDQDTLLKEFFGIKKPKGKEAKMPIRWNYVEDKPYPCNDTRALILNALHKANVSSDIINNPETEYRLWHLLYSVEDPNEIKSALSKFADEYNMPESFVDTFCKLPSFKNKKEYGAYSEKATKKLLAVMERGKTLSEACYEVYGRYSEAKDITRWETPADLKAYINSFRQYSLRNPIVEQCILETLRTVHDIWEQYGSIDEIHVELGRSMKSTADQRARMSQRNQENENANMRIKQLLMELKEDPAIADVRPYSPMQQSILRIYEEGALQQLKPDDKDYDEIKKISTTATPSKSELTRYKLWLEQKYRSPYTGRPISLAKLFTPAYQIEHVIPQSRYFDDSLSNKVICEAEVNLKKTNMLGLEFIKQHGGEIIPCTTLGDVRVLTEAEYTELVKDMYAGNRIKQKKLMMEDIPEEFIQRQMNDSRYISKVIKGLLSNIVREEGEEEATSKNVIVCTGGITDRLKQDWGLNDVWNTIVAPRFRRMNELTNSDQFGHWENKEGKRVFQTTMPLELQRGFSKKRIDHRHHAMDALVIALASRNIVSYLNNESARDTTRREDLRRLLCDQSRNIRKPWPTFTADALAALEDIIVSFKQYIRVINKASNYYEHYNETGKKTRIPQQSHDQWAVRKPLHKETVFGHVNLRRKKEVAVTKALENYKDIVDVNLKQYIKTLIDDGWNHKQIALNLKEKKHISKVEVFYFTDTDTPMVAVRKPLDDSFDKKRIESITDTGIQQILLRYLEAKGGDPKTAFSPEGIMELNETISNYNNGKPHQPILRVRVSEPMGEKYQIGHSGINQKKYVVAQSGTNLYFAIYADKEGKRSYRTIPLNEVIERLKQGLTPAPEQNEDGDWLKFTLSPNDLVYVPTEEEQNMLDVKIDKNRIFKFVSSSGNRSTFIPHHIASVIVDKVELLSHNKVENTDDGISIKSVCWKLEVNRLGNITNIIR